MNNHALKILIACAALYASTNDVQARDRLLPSANLGEDGTLRTPNYSGMTRFTITSDHATAAGAGPDVAIVAAAAGDTNDLLFTDTAGKLLASGFFQSVTVINAAIETPSVAELSAFDGVIVWSNFDFVDPTGLGNNLAQYVDNGGGVVNAVFSTSSDVPARFLAGQWADNDYDVIVQEGGTLAGAAGLGNIILPGHELVSGVTTFLGGPLSARPETTTLDSNATLVAEWDDGAPLVAFRTDLVGRRVDLGLYPPSNDVNALYWDAATDGDALLANALVYVTGTDPVDVEIRLVALTSPSTTDTTNDPSALPNQVCEAGSLPASFVVELWVSDIGLLNTGVTGLYADIFFNNTILQAVALNHTPLYPVLHEGLIDNPAGQVTNFGGADFDPHGIEPDWARIGYVEFDTIGAAPTLIGSAIGVGGVGVFGRPPPPPDQVVTGTAVISFDDVQACCLGNNDCAEIDEACCNQLGGTPLGNASTCGQTGACCYDSNDDGIVDTCEEITDDCCDILSGIFHGPGSQCGGAGACCFGITGGACFQTDMLCCEAVVGVFKGVGTDCLGDSDMNGIDDVCELTCPAAARPRAENKFNTACDDDGDCANLSVCIDGGCYVPKNKYLSLKPENPDLQVALRVTIAANDLFPGTIGESWWIVPSLDKDFPPDTFQLGCEPHYDAWDLVADSIHVADIHVTPQARYDVQAIALGCEIDNEVNYSIPVTLPTTGRWGDLVGATVDGTYQPPNGELNFDDIQACVFGFQSLPNAPNQQWTDVDGDVPNAVINLADVFRVVVAFQTGGEYPYDGPVPCDSGE